MRYPGTATVTTLTSKLGSLVSSSVLRERLCTPAHPLPPISSNVNKFPLEIWHKVAQYIFRGSDLYAFSCISPLCQSAAIDMLVYPHIPGHRLLRQQSFRVRNFDSNYLRCATFEVDGDSSVVVELGRSGKKKGPIVEKGSIPIPFEYQPNRTPSVYIPSFVTLDNSWSLDDVEYFVKQDVNSADPDSEPS